MYEILWVELVEFPTMRSAIALRYLYMYFFLTARRNAIKRKREDEFFFAENFSDQDQDHSGDGGESSILELILASRTKVLKLSDILTGEGSRKSSLILI